MLKSPDIASLQRVKRSDGDLWLCNDLATLVGDATQMLVDVGDVNRRLGTTTLRKQQHLTIRI